MTGHGNIALCKM